MQRAIALALVLISVALVGCGSKPIRQAQNAFDQGRYDDAVALLSDDKIGSRNRLLAAMEKGLILHHTGDYAASSEVFLNASALLQQSDFVSISEQGTALAINDWATTYRGEYAERLWIHTYQMMNFLLLNQAESAAVEARQALSLFEEHGDALENDFFSRALIGLAFEAVGLPNDAYIEYRKLSRLMPEPVGIIAQLVPLARQLGFSEEEREFRELAKEFQTSSIAASSKNKNSGELILFLATGRIPQKRSGNIVIGTEHRISFPVYDFPITSAPRIELTNTDDSISPPGITTNLGVVAQSSLAARGKKIAARQLARIGVKNALVDIAESNSETSAALVSALLFLLEEADTRAWETLPGQLTLVRVPLDAGTHDLRLDIDSNGYSTPLGSITIRPGQRVFRRLRTS